jgi:hypothetical protein
MAAHKKKEKNVADKAPLAVEPTTTVLPSGADNAASAAAAATTTTPTPANDNATSTKETLADDKATATKPAPAEVEAVKQNPLVLILLLFPLLHLMIVPSLEQSLLSQR